MWSGWEIFTLKTVFYLTIDFKKVVSDHFHAGSILIETNVSREKRGYQKSPET